MLFPCVDCLQALTDSGPTYRMISKTERHKTKHTHRKYRKLIVGRLKALSPICKGKKPLFLYKFANLDSPCIQHIGVTGEPRAQLGLGFYSSKGGGEGFLGFRIPDGLTFV